MKRTTKKIPSLRKKKMKRRKKRPNNPRLPIYTRIFSSLCIILGLPLRNTGGRL